MSWLSGLIKDLLIGVLNWWTGIRNIELREKAESYAEAAKQKLQSEQESRRLEQNISSLMQKVEKNNSGPKDDNLNSKEWNP